MVTDNTANRRKEQKSRAFLQLLGRTVTGAEVREASLLQPFPASSLSLVHWKDKVE